MDIKTARIIVSSNPMLRNISKVEHLDKGYSTDEKYVLWESDYPKYMLRLSEAEKRELRRADFNMVNRYFEHGVRCPKPYLFSDTRDNKACYMLLSYLQGENASEALPCLSQVQQFDIGLDAGQELQRIHEVCDPGPDFDWPSRREAEYREYIEDVSELGLSFAGQHRIETYVESNLGLLQNAQVCSQHGDYHAGNIIVREGRFVGVIDFTDLYWGDPVEDFYKTSWLSAPISIPFARGVVNGYLSMKVPNNFWERYNLYVAMGLYFSLVWGHRNHPASLWRFQERIEYILDTHDFEGGGPPDWYHG